MKRVLFIFILFPFYSLGQNFILNEIFYGELKDSTYEEPVWLGDSLAFSLHPGEIFICRFHSEDRFEITCVDGRNGMIKSTNVKRAEHQIPFKITYPKIFFPFTKEHTIFGTSIYSTCRYSEVAYWQKYFHDSTDFVGLTSKAFHKDTAAFYALFREPILDSDGNGEWEVNNWKLLNSYSDMELALILLKRNRDGRKAILFGMTNPAIVWSPFGDEDNMLEQYYLEFYNVTYTLFEIERKYNGQSGRKYNKEYNSLKKKIEKYNKLYP